MGEHLKCQVEGCGSQETASAYNNPGTGELESLCDDHAREAGYCLGCHLFCAGIESYDFSTLPGYCYDCVLEINAEFETDDDYDDEYDYEEDYY